MTQSPGLSNVLAASPELPPVDLVAKVIARFTGGVAFDARLAAKRSWGFLGENLLPVEAERLAALAAEAGLPCRVVPVERTVVPPEPVPVKSLRADLGGIFYAAGSEETPVRWERVGLVAAVPLKETTTFVKTVKEGPSMEQRAVGLGIMMVTGIPMGMGKSKEVKKTVQETELSVFMDVFVEEAGGLRRLHVDGQKFDYAPALGEARRHDSLGNFRLLLRQIAGGAAGAFRNHAVRGFQEGTPLVALGYDSPKDYEKELRWLLTLRAL